MPTALVTGVAGFIGSNLVRALLNRGHRVRGFDDFSTGRRENIDGVRDHDRFAFVKGDLRDPETVREALGNAEWVFHQAAVPSVPRSVNNPVRTTDVNCTGTATLLDEARDSTVERVVVASSSSVYGSSEELPKRESVVDTPESPYALSKYYTERLAVQCHELYGIGTVALRYFNVFGPRQDPHSDYAAVIPKFVRLMLDGERPTIYGDGEQSRDFTYVDNAVEANVRAAESDTGGVVCNVGCGGRVTVNELVDRINNHLGTDIDPIYDDPRPGDIRHSHADLSQASEAIGYEPVVGFNEGLERTIEHLQE